MGKKKTWIIALIAVVMVAFGVIIMIGILISPQEFADLAFEQKVKEAVEKNEVIDMREMTDFEWDTMYYSSDGYFSEYSIEGYIEDKSKILRDTNYELYNHILFVKDGILVKQIITNELFDKELSSSLSDVYLVKDMVKVSRDKAIFRVEWSGDQFMLCLDNEIR